MLLFSQKSENISENIAFHLTILFIFAYVKTTTATVLFMTVIFYHKNKK